METNLSLISSLDLSLHQLLIIQVNSCVIFDQQASVSVNCVVIADFYNQILLNQNQNSE